MDIFRQPEASGVAGRHRVHHRVCPGPAVGDAKKNRQPGINLKKIDLLVIYCGIYLASVLLAIARAFLKNPHMLILDEATSALDNNSQSRIQNLLEKRWKRKSSVIAVVHRLDIIKGYDKIAVMKSGEIGEIGSYSELMGQKGLLNELAGGKMN